MAGTRSSARSVQKGRTEFFEEGRALDAAGDAAANCWLCGDRIDYLVAANTTPDSHNLDHLHPVSERPDLQHDPTGWRHAHASCNQARGAKAATSVLGLGDPVPDWWD
jgi:hypothetical protein